VKHVTRVQGHQVKYLNRNNSVADCSISLKFGTAHVIDDTLEMFKVKGQRSRSQGQRSRSQQGISGKYDGVRIIFILEAQFCARPHGQALKA